MIRLSASERIEIMNKKKKIIQLTEGILLCCVIVVMTLLCIGIIKKEVKNTKGKLTETIGWYRIQDNKKVQVDLNQKIKADPQGNLYYIMIRLPRNTKDI